jgi:hypothetical protein
MFGLGDMQSLNEQVLVLETEDDLESLKELEQCNY